MPRRLALPCLLAALCGPSWADLLRGPAVGSLSADPASEVATAEAAACGGGAEVLPAFHRLLDVDGDGREDAILDWSRLRCDGVPGSCGSGGCRQEIWLAEPDGRWRLLLRERAHEVHVPVPGAVVLLLDGGDCAEVRICFRAYDAWGGALRELR